MESFLKVLHAIGAGIHWFTGWIIHPNRGGCCEMTEKLDKDKK